VLGQGSTFRFRIPAPIATDEAGQSLTGSLPRLTGIRVLVVDDNPVNRELARNILERADADVIEAEDGPAGIDLASIYPVDCILMDIRMPGMDGVMAARHVREHPGPNQNIPILAFTANSNDRFDRQDFDGLVAKPTTPQALTSAIAQQTMQEMMSESVPSAVSTA
jgi:CheY-like chemotaxis protein